MASKTKTLRKPTLSLVERNYTTLYDCEFDPSGQFIATTDDFGRLFIFKFDTINPCATSVFNCTENRSSKSVLSSNRIFAMHGTEDYLITGDVNGRLSLYRWSDCTSGQQMKPKLEAQILAKNAEINSITNVEGDRSVAYCAGSGDNAIHAFDLQTGASKAIFTGHTDYIHQLAMPPTESNYIYSASEDGTLRFWDIRTSKTEHKCQPAHDVPSCARSEVGDWLGCIAANATWFVTGGGPLLTMWHVGMFKVAHTFEDNAAEYAQAQNNDDYMDDDKEELTTMPEVDDPEDAQPTTYNAVYLSDNWICASGGLNTLAHYDCTGKLLGRTELNVDQPLRIRPSPILGDDDEPIIAICGLGDHVDLLQNPLAISASLVVP